MRPNPLADALAFMVKPSAFTPVFDALLVAAIFLAVLVWRRQPAQRDARHAGIWLMRVLTGCMWWQQTTWKIPPNYDGLTYFLKQMTAHAAIPLYGDFVGAIVLPNVRLFGPLVWGIEIVVAVSLLLGLWSRAGALIGLLMMLNLWLGLYSADGEWPWTYFMIVIVQVLFVIDPPGRVLGADALLRRRRLLG